MKKLGFIFKYSSTEGKGILVYGRWEKKGYRNDTPILFSADQILSEIKTGQLVYFDLDDQKVSNIERASLVNFRLDYINNFVSCPNNYNYISVISFESLHNIIFSVELNEERRKILKEIDGDYFDFLDEEDFVFLDILNANSDLPNCLPEFDPNLIIDKYDVNTITDIYNCFGKYEHLSECITLDVFDLSLWLDNEMIQNDNIYGKTIEEIKCLYDLFVMRKHYDKKGNEIKYKPLNDRISSKWPLLLSLYNENELCEIIKIAPKLQPALSVEFCRKHIELLTDEYGMPDVEICKLYSLNKISTAKTFSEYKEVKDKLYVYSHCGANHLDGEGIPMCKMGKEQIAEFTQKLEEQYEKIIKPNIISEISALIKKGTSLELQIAPEEFNRVGLFIDKYNKLKNNFANENNDIWEDFKTSFESLPKRYQNALNPSVSKCVNELAVSFATDNKATPLEVSYILHLFSNWITVSTKNRIKKLVNHKFSTLCELDELNNAYNAQFISARQYFEQYKHITESYNAEQFMKELKDYRFPINIQWYIISAIINLLGYKSLNSYEYDYIALGYAESIRGIESLIKWLKERKISDDILVKAEDKICSVLSIEDRWTLFINNIVQSPGKKNIRTFLDNAYITKDADTEVLKHNCFQKAMLLDIDCIQDTDIQMFIADHLDAAHQNLMEKKVSGSLKLYLWQKHPTKNFDWFLIKKHLYEMPPEIQIRLFRLIFGAIAIGKLVISIDELYTEFVNSSTPATPAICGILYILKEKKEDLNRCIKSSKLQSIIGEQSFSFLLFSKELFYPCNGYLAITPNVPDLELLLFYGELTYEKLNDDTYYVIRFYQEPVDIWNIRSGYDLDRIDIAKKVLLRNASVDVINNKYYINSSHMFFVKQFAIRYRILDKCGLLEEKGGSMPPLYTNCLRKYEDSEHFLCRSELFGDSDPNNQIPFFWCHKKICVRRAHFLLPPSNWEQFRFADLLYITLGQNEDTRDAVWRITGETSQFIDDYSKIYQSKGRTLCSSQILETDEKGIWNQESSTYYDIYDEEDDDIDIDIDDKYVDTLDYENFDDIYEEEPTYSKYNGTYAQDDMGYSDDEIDIIFDGDPMAYWNID